MLFHIAGVVHPTRGVQEFEQVNVGGTHNVLRAAEAAGVRRVVVVSSNSPFGFNPSADHRFDEGSPYNPYMGYGRSKQRVEALVQETQARGKLETVIIRPPWFYGPHQPPRQTLFFKMIKDGRFPILGDGTQKRSMAYVDNICQGLLLAATTERANGEVYWIADERPYTINEIVDTVQSVLEEEFGVSCAKRRLRLPAVAGEVARLADGTLQAAGTVQPEDPRPQRDGPLPLPAPSRRRRPSWAMRRRWRCAKACWHRCAGVWPTACISDCRSRFETVRGSRRE